MFQYAHVEHMGIQRETEANASVAHYAKSEHMGCQEAISPYLLLCAIPHPHL